MYIITFVHYIGIFFLFLVSTRCVNTNIYIYARSASEAHGDKLKLCYMDTDSLIYSIETKDFYKDIANDVESRFDTSGYPNDGLRPLPVGKNKV